MPPSTLSWLSHHWNSSRKGPQWFNNCPAIRAFEHALWNAMYFLGFCNSLHPPCRSLLWSSVQAPLLPSVPKKMYFPGSAAQPSYLVLQFVPWVILSHPWLLTPLYPLEIPKSVPLVLALSPTGTSNAVFARKPNLLSPKSMSFGYWQHTLSIHLSQNLTLA